MRGETLWEICMPSLRNMTFCKGRTDWVWIFAFHWIISCQPAMCIIYLMYLCISNAKTGKFLIMAFSKEVSGVKRGGVSRVASRPWKWGENSGKIGCVSLPALPVASLLLQLATQFLGIALNVHKMQIMGA